MRIVLELRAHLFFEAGGGIARVPVGLSRMRHGAVGFGRRSGEELEMSGNGCARMGARCEVCIATCFFLFQRVPVPGQASRAPCFAARLLLPLAAFP